MENQDNFIKRLRQAEAGEYYTPGQQGDFCFNTIESLSFHKSKKIEYLDCICAFDTETTSFEYNNVALGTMYCWMFGINGSVMLGRTWEQLKVFCNYLHNLLHLDPMKRRLIVYVHNLSFDFQFFRKHFEWHDVFARTERTPMYACTTSGIEFRCSYTLTNSSLATVGKNLIRCPVQKRVGDLDYSLVRTWATPLTEQEIGYCISDVLVVMALIYDRRVQEKLNIARIPLTQTGYARRACRSECLYKDAKHEKYLQLMRTLTLTVPEYRLAKLAFAGGFTHASPYHVGEIGYNLRGKDFTSSYPAVIVVEKFPMGRGEEIDPASIQSKEELDKLCMDFCCLMLLEFEDIYAMTQQDFYISESRCTAEDVDAFNGRIASAAHMIIAVTDVDWEIIQQCYRWKHFRVQTLWRYKKTYLPTPYVRTVLQLYKDKTELKGVAGEEENYARAKELLNSLYGMMATQIDRPEVVYNAEQNWEIEEVPLEDTLYKYNSDTRRFISYLWGCYVTAYARRNLWSGILALGSDYWYSDTDSVKVSNVAEHQSYFDNYNSWITKRLEAACDYHHIDYEYIRPKTVKGVEKPLGVWDDEGDMPRFKTLGAKRYMYTTLDKEGKEELHITCAGVGKKPAITYLYFKYKTLDKIFDEFKDGIRFPGDYVNDAGEHVSATGKKTHLYCDHEFDCDLTDYMGYTAPVHELSCINLSEADYNLGISGAFFEFLANYWQGKIETYNIL